MVTVPLRPAVRKSPLEFPEIAENAQFWDLLAGMMSDSPEEKTRNLLAIGAEFGRLRRRESRRILVVVALKAMCLSR